MGIGPAAAFWMCYIGIMIPILYAITRGTIINPPEWSFRGPNQ